VRATAIILVSLDLDDCAEGDPQTEVVRDVVRAIAETARHRIVGAGVRVCDVTASLLPPSAP